MEEYIDSFLSSSSWSEATLPERPSWNSMPTSQMSGVPLESSHESSDQKPNSYVVPLDQIFGNMPIHGANNRVLGLNPSAAVLQKLNNSLAMLHEQNQLLQRLPETLQSNHENGGLSRRHSLSGETESELASQLYADHAGVGANGCESSLFVQSLVDTQSTATVGPKWLPSYSSMPSLPADPATLQDLAGQGDYLAREADILTKEHTNEELLHVQRASNELAELQSSNAPCYISGSNVDLACDGMHANYEAIESGNGYPIKYYADNDSVAFVHPVANPNGSSTAKPRMRARRGQATDPHSIAERLRREKISERMKNLQELVPNSNRTDKASMLDEIIEYVKFLQLQVKVLSMSRLGAGGAVVPLLTDFKQEEAREMVLSSSVDAVHGLSMSQDDIEFEQEVLKLMESNVTAALQFLRSKGLCLMPVALASAVSSRKGSSITIPPTGRKKPISTAGIVPQRADSARNEKRDRLERSNGCNGYPVKNEEADKGTSSSRL